MKILIVDDESGIREMCGRALRSEGHEVAACESGEAALPRHLRMATVLFADVRGFTAFTEQVPPELAASRLDEMLACFIEAVYAEGGTVNKFIGDGAMAVFGVPLPHADPVAAAARAALRTHAVIGAPVNLAARLEEAACPGQILIGSETAVQLNGRFALAVERALCLDGIRAPVQASELL